MTTNGTTVLVVADPLTAEIDRDIELAQAELKRVEARHEVLQAAIDQATAEEGEALEAGTAHNPTVVAELQASRSNGQYAIMPSDAQWRAAFPTAAAAWDKGKEFEKVARLASARRGNLVQQQSDLQWQVIPRVRGAIHELEQKRARHVAEQERARASLADKPSALANFRRRWMGGT